MFKPFETAKALIDRAHKDIREFEEVEAEYVDPTNDAYRFLGNIDPQTGNKTFKALLVKPIPPALSVIAFDIVNCLRSALDHAVFDSAAELGGSPNIKSTKFPFGRDLAKARDDFRGKGREVPKSIHPKLFSFEPYKGGRMGIWEFNELRNYKIHRTLAPASARTGQVGLGTGRIKNVHSLYGNTPRHHLGY